MKYLFLAALILLINVCAAQQGVEVYCKKEIDCQPLNKTGLQVQCEKGFCVCTNSSSGVSQDCVLPNVTSSSTEETRLTPVALVGHICNDNKDCDSQATNVFCNTTRKQCVCSQGYVPSLDNQKCLPAVKFNDTGCEIAKQCLHSAGNTTCSEGVCLCDVDYHYTSGACWKVIDFGEPCSVTEECSHVQDAVCDDQHRCSCPETRVIAPSDKICLTVALKMEDKCIESIQCTQLLGYSSECVENRCQCHDTHHYSSDTKTCELNLGIGDECRADHECSHSEEESVSKSMRCLNKTCDCSDGFENNDGKCIIKVQEKSAAVQINDVSSIVISVMYPILMSLVL